MKKDGVQLKFLSSGRRRSCSFFADQSCFRFLPVFAKLFATFLGNRGGAVKGLGRLLDEGEADEDEGLWNNAVRICASAQRSTVCVLSA